MKKTPPKPTDYLVQAPSQDKEILTQQRLAALKARIERSQSLKEKEQKEQENLRRFISGLLGG